MRRRIGERGLERYASPRRVARVRARVQDTGAVTLAALDLIPPPFPYTLFIVAAGALEVDWIRFFGTLGVCRLIRFGVEGLLAARYGRGILVWLDSPLVQDAVAVCIVLAIAASSVSAARLARVGRGDRSRHVAV